MAESNDNVNLSVVQHGVNHLKIEHTPFPGKPGPNGKFIQNFKLGQKIFLFYFTEVTLETHTGKHLSNLVNFFRMREQSI